MFVFAASSYDFELCSQYSSNFDCRKDISLKDLVAGGVTIERPKYAGTTERVYLSRRALNEQLLPLVRTLNLTQITVTIRIRAVTAADVKGPMSNSVVLLYSFFNEKDYVFLTELRPTVNQNLYIYVIIGVVCFVLFLVFAVFAIVTYRRHAAKQSQQLEQQQQQQQQQNAEAQKSDDLISVRSAERRKCIVQGKNSQTSQTSSQHKHQASRSSRRGQDQQSTSSQQHYRKGHPDEASPKGSMEHSLHKRPKDHSGPSGPSEQHIAKHHSHSHSHSHHKRDHAKVDVRYSESKSSQGSYMSNHSTSSKKRDISTKPDHAIDMPPWSVESDAR